MNQAISRIENDVQDRDSVAWKMLCDYVDQLAMSGGDEFSPREVLGKELFSTIFTLPESISQLDKVRKISLYGSKLKRIPPAIGEMKSLEYFDAYTSYDLHWLPYEITNCTKLISTRISTRALYGNFKNRMGFPKLDHNPIKYDCDVLKCSICKKQITQEHSNQLWISLRVGTDIFPLLVNACSKQCAENLPTPPENYVQFAHKGGSTLKQPPDADELWELQELEREKNDAPHADLATPALLNSAIKSATQFKPFKLIKKIWER